MNRIYIVIQWKIYNSTTLENINIWLPRNIFHTHYTEIMEINVDILHLQSKQEVLRMFMLNFKGCQSKTNI